MPGLRDVGQATKARRETSIATMTTARLFSALAQDRFKGFFRD